MSLKRKKRKGNKGCHDKLGKGRGKKKFQGWFWDDAYPDGKKKEVKVNVYKGGLFKVRGGGKKESKKRYRGMGG